MLLVLLSLSAGTGLLYRLGRKWFGMERETGQVILEIHTGEWIGDTFSSYYIQVVGAGLLLLILSGVPMLFKGVAKTQARRWHRFLALVLALPLAATAISGMLYGVGLHWLEFSEETNDLLLSIHEGAWLGPDLKVFYVLLLGTGLLALGLFGLLILLPKKRGKVIPRDRPSEHSGV